MKRIKAMNGYTIAQATKRDEPRYTAGEYAVFFSADVRDYGFSNSYPEFDGLGSIAEAVENIAGSNYGRAVEIVSRRYTCVDWDEVEAVAAALDRGAEFTEDGEEIAHEITKAEALATYCKGGKVYAYKPATGEGLKALRPSWDYGSHASREDLFYRSACNAFEAWTSTEDIRFFDSLGVIPEEEATTETTEETNTTTETKGENDMNQTTNTTLATFNMTQYRAFTDQCKQSGDWSQFRAARKQWAGWKDAVDAAISAHRFEGTPADSVADLVEALGYEEAREAVASYVNTVGDWDARVSQKVREWAQTVPGALSEEVAREVGFYQSAHSCHVDQIAAEMMKTPAPVEEEPEELPDNFENAVELIRAEVEAEAPRSAWGRGVKEYALELVEHLAEAVEGGYFDPSDIAAPRLVARELLNGAGDWSQYSWGGCSLIYNEDIARRLCCPSELKKTRNGQRKPNAREEWLDTQARALYQAAELVKATAARVAEWCA